MSRQIQINLAQLEKDYTGQIVALDPDTQTVLASARSFPALFNKLKRLQIKPQDCQFLGPLGKPNTVKI